MNDTGETIKTIGHPALGQNVPAPDRQAGRRIPQYDNLSALTGRHMTEGCQLFTAEIKNVWLVLRPHMTEGRQLFTAEAKTLAKGPSTYDPLENTIRRFATSTAWRESGAWSDLYSYR